QGMNNGEVKRLQQFLVSQGGDIYPRGLVTGYYGILTRQAVGRFQIAQGIVSSDSDVEYGVVGPQTRERINSILGY
ncbi:MAG: peptidoglycan-binding domain-containing protein, partial [Candidatus Pacebacteria bacterium]|nr:peptidoglycan-binding domain-containing protein [Candidatus Paceibacterota bacterium]MDD4737828.1 peptidoglycan-binding domain-containing protein [Candidatus Paceibacterota bacterium]